MTIIQPELTSFWWELENAAAIRVFASELTVQPCEQAHGRLFDGLPCMGAVQRDARRWIRP